MKTQAEHDLAHPGKRCWNCPDTVSWVESLGHDAQLLRKPWYKRWFRRAR